MRTESDGASIKLFRGQTILLIYCPKNPAFSHHAPRMEEESPVKYLDSREEIIKRIVRERYMLQKKSSSLNHSIVLLSS